MTRRFAMMAAVATLVAACGGGAVPATTEPAGAPTTSPASTAASTTTTVTVGTTTLPTPAPTGSTTSTLPEAVVSPELAALRAAISESGAVSSGRMEGLIQVSGTDPATGPIDFEMPFAGAFDDEANAFSFSMDMSGLAAAAGDDEIPLGFGDMFGEMEFRQIGDIVYIKFPFISAFLGADTPWLSMAAEEGSSTTQSFTMGAPGDPTEMLQALEDADGSVEDLGLDEVNGTTATHYRVTFDVETLLEEATPEERAQLEAGGPLPTDVLPMDIWVTEDGYVVRYVMELDATQLDESDGLEHMSIRYDLFDLGEAITIEAPPADQVTAADELGGVFNPEDIPA